MNILINNLISDRNIDRISDLQESTNSMFVATGATVSKDGFRQYKNYMSSLRVKQHKEVNGIGESTVWDKIKRVERVKNAI